MGQSEVYREGRSTFSTGNWENPYTPDTPENVVKMNDWDEGFYEEARFDDDNPLNPK